MIVLCVVIFAFVVGACVFGRDDDTSFAVAGIAFVFLIGCWVGYLIKRGEVSPTEPVTAESRPVEAK